MNDKEYTIKFKRDKEFAKKEAEEAINEMDEKLNILQTRLQRGVETLYKEQQGKELQEHLSDLAGWLLIEWAIDGITFDEGRFMDDIYNGWLEYYDPAPEDEERFHDWFWTCTALASIETDKIIF